MLFLPGVPTKVWSSEHRLCEAVLGTVSLLAWSIASFFLLWLVSILSSMLPLPVSLLTFLPTYSPWSHFTAYLNSDMNNIFIVMKLI